MCVTIKAYGAHRARLEAAEKMAETIDSVLKNIGFPDNCHGDIVALKKALSAWEDLG